ncbi:hypothetical protein [Fangia hongkongensis]|uniref:hypothetical protein n=1 Tax=Fangia hongkongensis TaxID=270495 RepID=UPI00037A40D0|nr:hypothetical protein [Fangia hongkongensis]MBK2123955.1 hypothetical protein [Fangia hongkongensis]
MSEKDLSDEQAQKRIILQRKKAKAWITLLSIVAVIVFILLLVSIWRCYEKYQIAKVGVYAQQLLKEKYNKDFEIKSGSGRYASEANIYQYGAYPKGKPQFVFNVMLSGPHSKRMVDGYLRKQISIQAWAMIQPYMERISPEHGVVGVGSGTVFGNEDALYALHSRRLSLNDWVREYGKHLKIGVDVAFNFPLTQQSLKRMEVQTYDLIQMLKKKGFSDINIEYSFYYLPGRDINQLAGQLTQALWHQYKKARIADLNIDARRMKKDPNNPKANEYGFVRYDDIDKIHSPQDIAQFITWFYPKEEVLQQKNKEQSKDKRERV